jgi:hypothetical protein
MRGSSLVISTGLTLLTAAALLNLTGVDGPDGAMFLSGIFLSWSGLDLRKRWDV